MQLNHLCLPMVLKGQAPSLTQRLGERNFNLSWWVHFKGIAPFEKTFLGCNTLEDLYFKRDRERTYSSKLSKMYDLRKGSWEVYSQRETIKGLVMLRQCHSWLGHYLQAYQTIRPFFPKSSIPIFYLLPLVWKGYSLFEFQMILLVLYNKMQ